MNDFSTISKVVKQLFASFAECTEIVFNSKFPYQDNSAYTCIAYAE